MATTKQLTTLHTLQYMTADSDGRIPSVREMAAELGVTPATVQQSLNHLKDQGLAKHVPGVSRSWQPT